METVHSEQMTDRYDYEMTKAWGGGGPKKHTRCSTLLTSSEFPSLFSPLVMIYPHPPLPCPPTLLFSNSYCRAFSGYLVQSRKHPELHNSPHIPPPTFPKIALHFIESKLIKSTTTFIT